MKDNYLQLTDILGEIIKTKRQELAAIDKSVVCRDTTLKTTGKRSLKQALATSKTGIIAEFKRKSPSKGWIHADVQPEEVVPVYAANGAAALSILTDEEYFGGSLDFIRRVRPLVDIPILRKDFIIDPVQLYQAAEAGADAVLLIAACLSREDCAALTAEAHRLGLEVLLEIHSAEELDYITPDIDVVGVNNRHLGSFVTDVQTSFDLAPLLRRTDSGAEIGFSSSCTKNNFRPPVSTPQKSKISGDPVWKTPSAGAEEMVFISESGISDPETVKRLREAGFRGFLMGETFMKEPDPGAALATFIQAL